MRQALGSGWLCLWVACRGLSIPLLLTVGVASLRLGLLVPPRLAPLLHVPACYAGRGCI